MNQKNSLTIEPKSIAAPSKEEIDNKNIINYLAEEAGFSALITENAFGKVDLWMFLSIHYNHFNRFSRAISTA